MMLITLIVAVWVSLGVWTGFLLNKDGGNLDFVDWWFVVLLGPMTFLVLGIPLTAKYIYTKLTNT